VDRDDDDFGEFFIDGDEPTPNREDSDPDPGYAAFADDFDDPLADWPGPDPSLEVKLGGGDPAPDDEIGAAAGNTDEFEALENEETAPENVELAFPDDDDDGDEQSTYAPSASDSDDVGPADADTSGDFLPEDFLPENKDAPSYSDSDDVDEGRWPGDAAQTDEDIVDDFLADLDEADSTPGLQEAAPAPHPLDPMSTAAVTTGAVQRWADEGAEIKAGGAATAAAESADSDRRIPLFMIVIVVAALALLAAGGYGVMQQRNAMQGEIRDLQARLATAASPDESAAAREELRAMEVASERLEDQLEILRAENQSLQENVATLASTSESARATGADAEPSAAVTTTRASTDTGAAAPAGSTTSATNPGSSASTSPAGSATGADEPAAEPVADAETWFVNFGSYTRRVVAEQWSEQLNVNGGEVIVQTAEAGGRAVYRVRVTGLPDRDTAERVATGLEREFQLPRLWIGRE
jgi:cell division septation protein DedD